MTPGHHPRRVLVVILIFLLLAVGFFVYLAIEITRDPAESRGRFIAGSDSEGNRGEALYGLCVICHAIDGKGSPGGYPSLRGSKLVLGREQSLIQLTLFGLEGGSFPGNVRPPEPMRGFAYLSDGDMASLLTYVRQSFGNEGTPVVASTVARVRQETANNRAPYTHDELAAPDTEGE